MRIQCKIDGSKINFISGFIFQIQLILEPSILHCDSKLTNCKFIEVSISNCNALQKTERKGDQSTPIHESMYIMIFQYHMR